MSGTNTQTVEPQQNLSTPLPDQPSQPRTQFTPRPAATDTLKKMEMGVQSGERPVQTGGNVAAMIPNAWGLAVLPKPHSYFDGQLLRALVVAKQLAPLQQGFADQLAVEKAGEFGLMGRPYIHMGTPICFPLDPVTFERQPLPQRGCIWGKFVDLSSHS